MKIDILFEVSSEAGNKVGGIYTVLQSKSSEMKKHFGDKYYLIGYYDASSAKVELKEERPKYWMAKAFRELKSEGINCYFGRWRKGNDANLILIDAHEFMDRDAGGTKMVDKIKGALWEKYKIDSIMMPWDFTLNVGWAHAAGMLIEKLSCGKRVVAHFHEWISGAGLLYLKHKGSHVKTVFTTHATTLGRTKSAFEGNLMDEVESGLESDRTVDPQEAYKYKLEGKHLMEKVCAENADAFTAVSEVVGKEAEYILGVKPTEITPDALDFSRFLSARRMFELNKSNRWLIERFLYAYFLPYYKIDCSDALIIFTSGRYEFENKGIDIFIDALAKVNERIKGRPVFAFIFIPANVTGPRQDIMENVNIMDNIMDNLTQFIDLKEDEIIFSGGNAKEQLKDIDEFENKEKVKILLQIARDALEKKEWENDKLVSDSIDLFKNMKKNEEPPLSTFNLAGYDIILETLKKRKLLNRQQDTVKVIYYPTYAKHGDDLLNMAYYDIVAGADMGVFASRYEPWGYTPVESAAFMNVSVTTDLAGFGRFVLKNVGSTKKRGVKVLKVSGKQRADVVKQLADMITELHGMKRDELDKLRMDARTIAELDNWAELIKHYIEVYNKVSR